jgi:hypothetical protein
VSTVAVASAQLNDEHCGNSAKRENENIVTPDEIAAVCPSVFIRIVAEAIGHICCHIIARGRSGSNFHFPVVLDFEIAVRVISQLARVITRYSSAT